MIFSKQNGCLSGHSWLPWVSKCTNQMFNYYILDMNKLTLDTAFLVILSLNLTISSTKEWETPKNFWAMTVKNERNLRNTDCIKSSKKHVKFKKRNWLRFYSVSYKRKLSVFLPFQTRLFQSSSMRL